MNTYRVVNTFKQKTTWTIAVVSLAFSILIATLNFCAYILEIRKLSYWNISPLFIKYISKSTFYSVCFMLLFIMIEIVVQAIIEWLVDIEAYYYYHLKRFRERKSVVDSNKNQNRNYNKKRMTIIKTVKLKNFLYHFFLILLLFAILFAFSIIANSLSKISESDVIKRTSVETILFMMLHIVLFFILKKESLKSINKRGKKPNKFVLLKEKMLSDRFIITSIINIIVMGLALFIFMTINTYYSCKHQKDFYITSFNNNSYVMIYENENQAVFLNASISDSILSVNLNKQLVRSGDYELEYKTFDSIEILYE